MSNEKILREYVSQFLLSEGQRYYFAYGANMDQSRLYRRSYAGPPCVLDTHLMLPMVGRAVLPNHRIGFAGHSETWNGPTATILSSPGEVLPGVLYKTDPEQEASLSCFENADGHSLQDTHKKISVEVECDDGHTYPAYTFIRVEGESDENPSNKYTSALTKSYREMFGESANLLREYIREILIESPVHDKQFKTLMNSGFDGIKQAMELASHLGIPSQELPWDIDSVDAWVWNTSGWELTDETLKPTGWTEEDYVNASREQFHDYEASLGYHELERLNLRESVDDDDDYSSSMEATLAMLVVDQAQDNGAEQALMMFKPMALSDDPDYQLDLDLLAAEIARRLQPYTEKYQKYDGVNQFGVTVDWQNRVMEVIKFATGDGINRSFRPSWHSWERGSIGEMLAPTLRQTVHAWKKKELGSTTTTYGVEEHLVRERIREILLEAVESEPDLTGYVDRLWDVIIDVLNTDYVKSGVKNIPINQELAIEGVEAEIFSDYENINRVNVYIAVNEFNDERGVQVQAHYECNVRDRSKSDLVLALYIPREYSDIPDFERWLEFDLADALSHELQHSCDTTEMLTADIPEGEEKWESIDNIYRHFASDAETRGYVAGILGRGRRMEMRGNLVDYNQLLTDDLVGRVFDQALLRGYSAEELHPVMNSIATKWDQRMTDVLERVGAVDVHSKQAPGQ